MLKVGDKFGSYTVIRHIGQGGMGSVFLLESGGKTCVAKILNPHIAGDHESRVRFVREAEIALKIKHPSLVETYDVGEDPETGLCYILMEYVGGGSLEDLIKKRGKLSVNEALKYTYEIAKALDVIKQYGIIHRDLKPGNIMFTESGEIKLTDLGIARSRSEGSTTITKTNIVMGTPAYMSPEQMINPHSVDTRSDIYSLGIILFEMLTGKRPHSQATFMELMAKAVQAEKIPDIRTVNSTISKPIALLIAKMCEPNLNKRIATPQAVVKAIGDILSGKSREIKLPKWVYTLLIWFVCGIVAPAFLLNLFVILAKTNIAYENSRWNRTHPQPPERPQVRKLPPVESPAPKVTETPKAEAPAKVEEPKLEDPTYVTKSGIKVYTEEINGIKWYYTLNGKGEAQIERRTEDDGYDKAIESTAAFPQVITIPELLHGHPVRSTGHNAFSGIRNVEEFILPEGITNLGYMSFASCHEMKRMRFPDSLKEPAALSLMWNCWNLEYFDANKCTNFSSAMTISTSQKLRVVVSKDNEAIVARGERLFSRDGKRILFVPRQQGGDLEIPEGVESLSDYLLEGMKIDRIKLPSTLRHFTLAALSARFSQPVVLPEGITGINWYNLKGLTTDLLVLPKSLDEIGDGAFDGSIIKRIMFNGDRKEHFSGNAFRGLDPKKTEICVRKGAAGWSELKGYPITVIDDAIFDATLSGKTMTKVDKYTVIADKGCDSTLVTFKNDVELFFPIVREMIGIDDLDNGGKVKHIEIITNTSRISRSNKDKVLRIGNEAMPSEIRDAVLSLATLHSDAHQDEFLKEVMDLVKFIAKEKVAHGSPTFKKLSKEQRLIYRLMREYPQFFVDYFKAREELYRKKILVKTMTRHDFIALISKTAEYNLFPLARKCGINVRPGATKIDCRKLRTYDFDERDVDFIMNKQGRK